MTSPADAAGSGEVERASTLELFLDLVFVFTVTQLTQLVSQPEGLAAYGQAALILAVTWWMYDGYVWLTGNVSMRRPVNRVGIFVGMAGFLLMALAIPGVFTDTNDAVVFGLAYLGVNVVHAVLFSTAGNSSAHAIWRIAPFNIAARATGADRGIRGRRLALDALPRRHRRHHVEFVLRPVTGLGDPGLALRRAPRARDHRRVRARAWWPSVPVPPGRRWTPGLAATATLALGLSAAMWWVYFDRDDEAAAQAFAATGGNTRSRLGLWIAYVHVVMVAGVILMAAGVRAIVADPGTPARAAAAWNVAAGVSLYVAGESAFRSVLRLGPSWRRAVVVGAVVLTVPVGQWVSGVLQLVLVTAAMVVLILTEGTRAGQLSGAGDAAGGRGGG